MFVNGHSSFSPLRTEKKGDMPSNGWRSTGSRRGAARCLDHLK